MRWGGAVDVLSCDGFLADDWEIGADMRLEISPECVLKLPLGLDIGSNGSLLFSAGIALACHPWKTGPFIQLSLIRLGFLHDREVPGRMVLLDELSLGWTFKLSGLWFVEPMVSFRDPSLSYQDEYAVVKDAVEGYRVIRVGVRVGVLSVGKEEIQEKSSQEHKNQ